MGSRNHMQDFVCEPRCTFWEKVPSFFDQTFKILCDPSKVKKFWFTGMTGQNI